MATSGWGQRLKQRARELGLSDAEVARRLGIPQRRYSSYANEAREPHFAEFERICAALATTPNEVLGVASAEPTSAHLRRAAMAFEGMTPAQRDLAVAVIELIASGPAVKPSRSRR